MLIRGVLVARDGTFNGIIEILPQEVDAFVAACTREAMYLVFKQNGTRLRFCPTKIQRLKWPEPRARTFPLTFCADYYSGELFCGKPIEIFPDAALQWQDPLVRLSEYMYYAYVAECHRIGLFPLENPTKALALPSPGVPSTRETIIIHHFLTPPPIFWPPEKIIVTPEIAETLKAEPSKFTPPLPEAYAEEMSRPTLWQRITRLFRRNNV